MDHSNNLTSVSTASTDLDSNSLDLTEQTWQFDANTQRPNYQGISVRTLDTLIPVYHSQSGTPQNEVNSFHLLNEYNIVVLTLNNQEHSFETNIPETLHLVLEEDVTWNSGNESVNNTLSSTRNSNFAQQVCLSGSEPEIREPIPASHSDSDYQLTNLPVLSNPKNPGPFTVVSSLNLNQKTPAEEAIAEVNSLIVECQKKRKRERQKERYQNDPDYAERHRERNRELQRERRKDPAYLDRKREDQKQRRKDPAYRERERLCQRERRKDPVYAERERKHRRDRARERYHNDPDYVKRRREIQRKHKHNNPNCAKPQKK